MTLFPFANNCSKEQAIQTLQRVRQAVNALTFPTGDATFTVSISIGVATSQSVDEALLGQADAALYAAKNVGRDKIMHAAHQIGPERSSAREQG